MLQIMDYSNEPCRDILCIDVKSFFASVEAVERKEHPLKAKVAVVSKPDNNGGLVLASSPMVKKLYGIKTGTRVYEIPKDAAIDVVEPRMALYLEKNIEIVNIFKRFVAEEDLHVYSIDESFLDVTHSHRLFGSTEDIAKEIQYLIWKEMKLVVTIGIGDNPLLAKLALDHSAKHDRSSNFIATWHYQDVQDTVWEIAPLRDFWGIGSRTEQHLQRIGIHSIYELSQADVRKLKKRFGVIGEQLFFHAHGIDRTLLSETFTPKATSFSKNQILNRDYVEKHEVEIVIREMAEENATRLRRHHLTTGVVKLSIGFSKDIDDRGFSHQLPIEKTDSSKKIIEGLLILFNRYYKRVPVRVVNVTFGKIEPKSALQLSLFDSAEKLINQEDLDQTIDSIRHKYGYTSLLHASSLSNGGTALYRSKLLGGHRSGKER
ncbi:Y-family DNA polymerase [Alkalibacterium olivapovliticus]|uniref:DNA polymerase V n=1 Tax=Alkalibacterium olivapovliticus TaxID=99907 RepID=A0A2T0W5H2_9LACT|nr:Y-family DNA polymerase [Alkalibacterium olivapovliticus]PRY80963.1 DNA polymerase V [Alkalibacterium olivapovliticus]